MGLFSPWYTGNTYNIFHPKHPFCCVVLNFTLPCHRRQEIGSIYEAQLMTRSKTYPHEISHRYGGYKFLVFLKHSFDHMSRKLCGVQIQIDLRPSKFFVRTQFSLQRDRVYWWWVNFFLSRLQVQAPHRATDGSRPALTRVTHFLSDFQCHTQLYKSPMFHVHVPVQGPMTCDDWYMGPIDTTAYGP